MTTELIDEFDMLPPGSRVLCAVSGGADSVYLLHGLLELAPERGWTVCAAHYDHGLRGAESERDAAFVREMCERCGVPFVTERGDAAACARDRGMGIEEAARELRYGFLRRGAEELSCHKIATAHTADDNAETLLLNLARGSGLRGLSGIPPVRGKLIRPMLTTARREIEAALAARSIPHVEDSSNSSDSYARNRLRHGAVPVLESVNAGFIRNASRAALLLREDEALLDTLAREALENNAVRGGVPASALAALPRPLSARLLRLMAERPLTAEAVESALALTRGEGLAHADVAGGRFTRDQGVISFGAEAARPIAPALLAPGGRVLLPEAGLAVTAAFTDAFPEINSSFNTFFFNYENICGNIYCTSRIPGDRIRLAGRGCTKRLSDLFTEKKLTQRQRELAVVLRDDIGPLAVCGFGGAERCAAAPGRRCLRIDIEPGEKL